MVLVLIASFACTGRWAQCSAAGEVASNRAAKAVWPAQQGLHTGLAEDGMGKNNC